MITNIDWIYLENFLDSCVPKTIKQSSKTNLPWFNYNIICLIRKKRKYYLLYKRNNDPDSYIECARLKAEIQLNKSYKEFYHEFSFLDFCE